MLKSSGRSVDGFCNDSRSDGHKSILNTVQETGKVTPRLFFFVEYGVLECSLMYSLFIVTR